MGRFLCRALSLDFNAPGAPLALVTIKTGKAAGVNSDHAEGIALCPQLAPQPRPSLAEEGLALI